MYPDSFGGDDKLRDIVRVVQWHLWISMNVTLQDIMQLVTSR